MIGLWSKFFDINIMSPVWQLKIKINGEWRTVSGFIRIPEYFLIKRGC